MLDVRIELQKLAFNYEEKHPQHEPIVLHVRLRDDDTLFCVDLRKRGAPEVREAADPDAFYTWRTDRDTLRRMVEGDLSPGTAAAMEQITDDAPLKAVLPEGESWTMDHYHKVVEFETAFFNPFNPDRIRFGEAFARPVHGGHAVSLFTARGLRSAWYSVHKGERINDEGHANPFPSGIIVLSGQARGRIDGREVDLVANEAYLIPAGATHSLWNEEDEPCTAIWIAWGIGA
jgi:mannose-6-phosphate isomerase-like protein (cupin superfamily)